MYKKTYLFCITKFLVQLAIDFDCKEIWVHFLQFHIPPSVTTAHTLSITQWIYVKKKKTIGVLFTVDYDQTLWFICIYDFYFFFFFINFKFFYQASKIHLLCALYKCWGWTKSTKVYIHSSQKGHDRQKIVGKKKFWLIGR